MNKYSKATTIFFISSLIFLPATNHAARAKIKNTFSVTEQPNPKQKITYKIIPAASSTWGYDIYVDGTLTVHQPTRPGLPGNMGFRSAKNAEKVAKLVVGKIKHNQMPPSVSVDEMNKLKAL